MQGDRDPTHGRLNTGGLRTLEGARRAGPGPFEICAALVSLGSFLASASGFRTCQCPAGLTRARNLKPGTEAARDSEDGQGECPPFIIHSPFPPALSDLPSGRRSGLWAWAPSRNLKRDSEDGQANAPPELLRAAQWLALTLLGSCFGPHCSPHRGFRAVNEHGRMSLKSGRPAWELETAAIPRHACRPPIACASRS